MELDQRESALTGMKEDAQRTQAFAQQKAEEAQQERRDIAQDQQTIIAREDGTTADQQNRRDTRAGTDQQGRGDTRAGADQQGREDTRAGENQGREPQSRDSLAQGTQPRETTQPRESRPAAPAGVLGMWLTDSSSPLGRLVRVNPASGEEVQGSAINTVNVRTLVQTGGKLIAVAGENRGSGAIRLVEINSSTLEMVKQGDDDIHPESLLWLNGNSLYAIVSSGGNLYLAKFNTNLVREARSSVAVHAFAVPMFQGNDILIQRADGSPVVLTGANLSEKK
jgi:hypothetical protein